MIPQPVRAALLFAASALMGFAAVVNVTTAVPHLVEDMVEIGMRPTLLAGVLLALRFGSFAMFGFAGVVLAAAFRASRGGAIERLPLAIVALTYVAFGIASFVWSRSPHTLGYVFMGVLVALAVARGDEKAA